MAGVTPVYMMGRRGRGRGSGGRAHTWSFPSSTPTTTPTIPSTVTRAPPSVPAAVVTAAVSVPDGWCADPVGNALESGVGDTQFWENAGEMQTVST